MGSGREDPDPARRAADERNPAGTGFALAGVLKFLEAARANSKLDSLRNVDGEVLATFICCDTPLPYLDKYSTHLDAADF